MRIKNKILSGILAISAVACVSLGIAFQSDNNVTASAVSGLSVNTLGYLEWTAVDGATSYEVSSAYGTVTTTDTKVNVGDAIMKAAKSATADEASVAFTVTPVGAGEASEYTYSFKSYIDYSFETRDYSEVEGAEESLVSAAATNGTNGVDGAISKNSLFTFNWSTAKGLGTSSALNEWIYLFGKNGHTWENTANSYFVWGLRLRKTNIAVYLNGSGKSAKGAVGESLAEILGDIFSSNITAFQLGTQYKFTVGVFDTYGVNGAKTGETLYVRLDNATNKEFIREAYMFVDNETLIANAVTDNGAGGDDYVNASGFGICGHNADYIATVTAGNGYDATSYGKPLYEATGLSLSTNGDIGVNLYVKNLSNVTGAFKAELTFNGETEVVDFVETQTAGVYKVSKAVAPKYIDEKITARVFVAGGPMGKSVQYSVRDYINSVDETDGQYAITQALANYCDSVATFFNAEAEQPELDETDVDLSNYAPTLVSADENVVPYGISLIVEDKTTIRFFFKVKGEMPEVFKANGEDVEVVADAMEGFYYIDLVDIDAKDLDKDFEFQVGNCKVQCSALTYGLSVLGDGESDNKTVNLVKALYAYNQAAKDFFGNE